MNQGRIKLESTNPPNKVKYFVGGMWIYNKVFPHYSKYPVSVYFSLPPPFTTISKKRNSQRLDMISPPTNGNNFKIKLI
jgi:hypothetical protein